MHDYSHSQTAIYTPLMACLIPLDRLSKIHHKFSTLLNHHCYCCICNYIKHPQYHPTRTLSLLYILCLHLINTNTDLSTHLKLFYDELAFSTQVGKISY